MTQANTQKNALETALRAISEQAEAQKAEAVRLASLPRVKVLEAYIARQNAALCGRHAIDALTRKEKHLATAASHLLYLIRNRAALVATGRDRHASDKHWLERALMAKQIGRGQRPLATSFTIINGLNIKEVKYAQ